MLKNSQESHHRYSDKGNKNKGKRSHEDENVSGNDGKNSTKKKANANKVLIDPHCNPDHPHVIHFEDVTSAAFKIKNGIINTPCTRSQLSDICGMEIYLKKDFLQVTGRVSPRESGDMKVSTSVATSSTGVLEVVANQQKVGEGGFLVGRVAGFYRVNLFIEPLCLLSVLSFGTHPVGTSFKERGARYALMMLSEEQKVSGVISASLGNHALALCYHGKQLNIPVTVVMPVIAPIMKIQSCRKLGANVIIQGKDMGEAKRIAMTIAEEKKLCYINGYDHPHIMAGQGTIGLEVMEQVPDLDAIVVPVGGGGLIAGIATAIKAMKPKVQIIGVESDRCPSFRAAQKEGKPSAVTITSTLADGLAVPTVGYNAFLTANPLINKMIVVGEEWIAIAILRLVELEKSVVEGAGATGLAAVLAGHLDELKGKKVVILLCGGNIDTTILGRCLERGLAADGRLLKLTVCVSDRPGGIAELCRLLADKGASIKDMMHDRAWLTNDVFSVNVKVICETRDLEHSMDIMKTLCEKYEKVHFVHIPNLSKISLETCPLPEAHMI